MRSEGTVTISHDHDLIKSRMVRVYADINRTTHLLYKIDMLKIYKNINDMWAKLDNEMIACRTWHKRTPAYETLAKEISTRLDYLDKHLMWAKLL
jgi:hypothetical protein